MPKIVICSGCDHDYFPLLREMIESLKRFPQAADFHFAVLDTGLQDADLAWLDLNVQHVVRPDWPCAIPAWKIRGRDYLKSCVCRPFLPQFFPGYDVYLWLDADMWVQDWAAIDLFVKGAQHGRLAVVPQVDRAYPRALRIKWLGPLPYKIRGFYFSNARKAFGLNVAKALTPNHVLNAGIFAMTGDAPHWAYWQSLIKKALRKGKVFTAEQLTLGMMCHLGGYPYELLPAWCNWLCENPPVWDEARGLFVEPYLPNLPISVMHISGYDEMRRNRSQTAPLLTLSGKTFAGSLRYPHYDGERGVALMVSESPGQSQSY